MKCKSPYKKAERVRRTPAHIMLASPHADDSVAQLIDLIAQPIDAGGLEYSSRLAEQIRSIASEDLNESINAEGDTLLSWAATHDNVVASRALIAARCDVNAHGGGRCIAMSVAASWGHIRVIELLVAANAEVNLTAPDNAGGDGGTALLWACREEHPDIVKLLIAERASIDQGDTQGATPLHWACDRGSAECVELLVGANAEVNLTDREGSSALSCACLANSATCVRMLIEAKASVGLTVESPSGGPLLEASGEGFAEIVLLLIEARAHPDQVTENALTPLFAACLSGQPECARLLLDAGAAVDQTNAGGSTPLAVCCDKVACQRALLSVERELPESNQFHLECVRVLISRGADVNKADVEGCTPLMVASLGGHTDCVRLLLEAGAVIDEKVPASGERAIHLAIIEGHMQCVQLLSSYGADRSATQGTLGTLGTLAAYASAHEQAEIAAWLKLSETWSPLHHVEVLCVKRARELLRAGVEIDLDLSESHPPSPFRLASSLSSPTPASELVRRAGLPWSPETQELFPLPARRRAVVLMHLGYLKSMSFPFESQSFVDAWRCYVLPHALRRDSGRGPEVEVECKRSDLDLHTNSLWRM
jgi:ankyrin repeat protein